MVVIDVTWSLWFEDEKIKIVYLPLLGSYLYGGDVETIRIAFFAAMIDSTINMDPTFKIRLMVYEDPSIKTTPKSGSLKDEMGNFYY